MICFKLTIDLTTQMVTRVQRLAKPPDIIHESQFVKYVFRASEDEARAFYNDYMRKKVQERREKYDKEEKCRCGRERDRTHPSGVGFYKKCTVCIERQGACLDRIKERR